jgi:hypothetical protein
MTSHLCNQPLNAAEIMIAAAGLEAPSASAFFLFRFLRSPSPAIELLLFTTSCSI